MREMATVAPSQPFSRDGLFRTVGPLIGAAFFALLGVALSSATQDQAPALIKGATLAALALSAMQLLPWHKLPPAVQVGPALAYLMVAAVIRQATGGPDSMYAQLVLVPLLWLAVFGSVLELAVGVASLATVLAIPMMLTPGGQAQLPGGLTLLVLAGGIGFGVQRLFEFLRAHSIRLNQLARTDPLTGVANRRAWDEEIVGAVERSSVHTAPLCVSMIDLDHFKDFNDTRGHQAGDRLLKEITAGWRSQLRDGDTLARLGGDEFAIVLPGCPLDAAQRIVQRLCESMPQGMTCSTGLASWDGTESAHDLIARADAAVYEAKDQGRNRIIVAA